MKGTGDLILKGGDDCVLKPSALFAEEEFEEATVVVLKSEYCCGLGWLLPDFFFFFLLFVS